MKFGQQYQSTLDKEEFPQEWVDSAINYKKLKKCIKRVRKELLSLGLDQQTLQKLWQHVAGGGSQGDGSGTGPPILSYKVEGDQDVTFIPKLTIALDPKDGSPVDAWLSPETRSHLRHLAKKNRAGSVSPSRGNLGKPQDQTLQKIAIDDDLDVSSEDAGDNQEPIETVEVMLTAGSEFLDILRQELESLEKLQDKEEKLIHSEITQLGHDLRELKVSRKKRSKEEIETWRKVFEIYNDAEVFVSSHENDAGARDVDQAQKHFDWFLSQLAEQRKKGEITLDHDARAAVDRFIRINNNLLRLLKFQAMNRTALSKIMKKFDKQTALHMRAALPSALERASAAALSDELARVTSFTISHELVHIIPQLNDYLCPVCYGMTYKPVRLSCGHVYCIRCILVMQREKQNECPLCRAPVVLAADSDNVDLQLKHFLERNFKVEVKEKQKENERAAAVDRFGEAYTKSEGKCEVM
ncbi:hypothetical protein DV737_g4207, partial [Chaetothyriales sp. CBS 132003]